MGGIAQTVATALAPISPILSAAGAVAGIATGVKSLTAKGPKAAGTDPSVRAAQLRQQALLKQQEASQVRLQQQTDARETQLSADLAAQKRAVAAGRRGRGALAFNGPTTSLKNTLGG